MIFLSLTLLILSCRSENTTLDLETAIVENASDPIIQMAYFEELIAHDTSKAVRICRLDSDSLTHIQQKCEHLLQRPHLFQQLKEKQSDAKSSKNNLHQIDHEKIADVLQNCSTQNGLSERECITKNTKYFVMRGNIKKVAAFCNHLEERWRGECYFNTAEFLVQSKGSSGYSEGVDLCLSAEPFVKNCLEHLIMQLAQFAPSSLTSRREHWHKIYSAENAIRSAWSFRDKLVMQENIERLWSEALGISYFNSNPVTGDPFDALEERHHPHIRSAAMRRLLAINSPNTKSLDDWIQLAKTSMKSRENGSPNRDKSTFLAVADLWEKPNSDIQSIVYMATSQRPTHPDVQIDLILAILEGAARRPPNNKLLLKEATNHSHPLIGQSALRLLSKQK